MKSFQVKNVTFGDGPEVDNAIIAKENPADPATWQWTTADKKFIKIIKKDYLFNVKCPFIILPPPKFIENQ